MRKIALGLILVLVLAAAGWSILWSYASNEAARQLDGWVASEASQGRTWTCPNRVVAGYPFALTITCTRPTFTGSARDQTVQASVGTLVAAINVTNPRHLDVTLAPPLVYRTSDGKADVKADWSRFVIGADAGSLSLQAADLGVDGNFGDTGRQSGNAKSLTATFERLEPESREVIGFTIGVRGAGMPPLDALLGEQSPVDVDVAGHADHASAEGARTPEEAIERWRQAGGQIEIVSSRISRGESSVSGAGRLQIDDAHLLRGQIDASFVGLEPVLKRYGISGNVAAAGNLLNSLFGGGPKQAAPQQNDPNALNLPIIFRNGRIGIGPIQTPLTIPPLY